MPEAKQEPEAKPKKPLDLSDPDDSYVYRAMSERTSYGDNPLGEWFVVEHLSDLPALKRAGFEIKRKKK